MSNEKQEVVLQDQSTSLPKTKLLLLFAGLQTALFLSFIDSTSVSTMLPIIGKDLNASSSITWAGTGFLVANTSFQIVTSRLSDCLGRKVVLMGSLAIFAFGDLLAGFATNKVWLYTARAVAGIGGGGINSLTMIIVSDVVTHADQLLVRSSAPYWLRRQDGHGHSGSSHLKPLVGGIKEKLKHMDWIGTVLSLTMTVCLLVPLSGGGSTFPWDGPVVITLFIVGGVSLAAFIYVEAKVARLPLFPGRILTNRNVCLLVIQTWLVGMVFYGGIYFTPLYLQNVRGHSAIMSAALLLPLVLAQVPTTSISGFVVKYTNRTWASFFVGFVFWAAGQGGQLCFNRTTSNGVIVGCLLLQGLGIGSTIQSTLVLAQASGPPADRAAVTGVRNFARTSGGAIGLAIGNTALQNVFLENLPTDLPKGLGDSLREVFEIPAGLDAATKAAILDAYMKGLQAVFIYFVPVVGLCLVMCAFIKDIPLDDSKPAENGTLPVVRDMPAQDFSRSNSEEVKDTESEETRFMTLELSAVPEKTSPIAKV
ncbi:hypothetical protein CI109_104415 [Kwoniella shandongensis]|uniref:Major facilitator superfamily (MFS) profile domain-containing protein n=1 Tax=Kwoniella shandongensis TaxID=1734106 RepID=A0AAJ8LLH1_9TREE